MNNTVKALLELFSHNKLDAAQLAAEMINLVESLRSRKFY